MRLSEGVEWGLHCCVVLAVLPPGETLPAARLAEYHDVPPAYLAKHLQALARVGVVESVPGARGGYRLTRPAAEISVLEVVEAIEGPAQPFVCTEIRQRGPAAAPPGSGAYRAPCGIARAMERAEDAYRRELARQSLADLVADIGRAITPATAQRFAAWYGEIRRPEKAERDMSRPSIGLVLGAGGVVGAAYHAGAVAALSDTTGWDPRHAAVIVGTSAGSGMGATIRAGFPPADFLARATDQALSPEGQALVGSMTPVADIPMRPPRLGLRRPAAPWLLGSLLGWPPRVRPGPALAGLLPAGTVDTAVIGDRIRAFYGERRWPDDPLWICALRLSDGRRVVFGRDEEESPDIGTACEASSAIPGFFRPVRIGDDDYVDGGAYSPTNADLVAGLGLDAVVVVSPMSAVRAALRRPAPNTAGRRLAGAALAREVRAVRAGGTPVLTIQPTADDLRVMGVNAMDPRRRDEVARRSFESARRRLDDPRAAEVGALLRG